MYINHTHIRTLQRPFTTVNTQAPAGVIFKEQQVDTAGSKKDCAITSSQENGVSRDSLNSDTSSCCATTTTAHHNVTRHNNKEEGRNMVITERKKFLFVGVGGREGKLWQLLERERGERSANLKRLLARYGSQNDPQSLIFIRVTCPYLTVVTTCVTQKERSSGKRKEKMMRSSSSTYIAL